MSMNRTDQKPGRGSGSSCRAKRNPVHVTTAAASQRITPAARTHGVDPDTITTRPATPTASARYPTRRAQTAILQCPLCCSSAGSSMPLSMPEPPVARQGPWTSESVFCDPAGRRLARWTRANSLTGHLLGQRHDLGVGRRHFPLIGPARSVPHRGQRRPRSTRQNKGFGSSVPEVIDFTLGLAPTRANSSRSHRTPLVTRAPG